MPFFDGAMLIDGDGSFENPKQNISEKTSSGVSKEDSSAAARAKQNTAVTGTGFTTNKNLLAITELQDQLDKLKADAAVAAEKKAKELAQIEADKELARQAKAEALGATREAKYFSNQTQAQIQSTKDLGFQGLKPPDPPSDASYEYKYIWRSDVGGGGSGQWNLVKFPKFNAPVITAYNTGGNLTASNTGGNQGYSGGNNYVEPTPLTPNAVSATPSTISPATQSPPKNPVKTAPIDTVLFDDDSLPDQVMYDLIFENIGGQELINIARNDTVNGQKIIYQPIKNLFNIQQEYNPNNIVSIEGTSNKYFQNFPINFDSKVPNKEPGEDHVYIDPQTGEVVIEAINLETDEQIEVQIVIDGTIYEVEL
jgi:hypothetical protein